MPRKGRSDGKGTNPKASTFWHQGFGVIRGGGVDVVPFVSRQTCERIAQNARDKAKVRVFVFQVNDGWGFSLAPPRKSKGKK